MAATTAPGWGSDWLNGWLAAIGATVLVPNLRLAWTPDPRPVASFEWGGGEPVEGIVSRLPAAQVLGGLSIARSLPGAPDLPRKVLPATYLARAQVARERKDPFLGATLTDLQDPIKEELPHSRFDPPVPRGITLWERLVACCDAIGNDPSTSVRASMAGALRVAANGLGFDARRFPAGVQPSAEPMVDPVVECLAFFGLSLFPTRGNGGAVPRTRGWVRNRDFEWVAWSAALDCWAIDALLDQVHVRSQSGKPQQTDTLRRLGVTAQYQSVAFQPVGSADTRRGYASRRMA